MNAFSTFADHLASRIPAGIIATALTLAVGSLAGAEPAPTSDRARADEVAVPDPARFILNALLAPALDVDALPLRWVDPRPVVGCAGDTEVWVDGEPLQAGALVPDAPFDLRWQSRQCRPFGLGGLRYDGSVTLRIHREDWGFSAFVWPEGLVATTHLGARVRIDPGPASMPQSTDTADTADTRDHLDPANGD